MSFGEIDIVVDGKAIDEDVDAMLEIGDVSDDMNRVASQMCYWGSVWAAAEAERLKADSYYRQWKAQLGEAIVKKDPKIASWKVSQAIEAHPKFAAIKQGLARAAGNATICKAIYESFRVKANMLQSKGAMLRAELESTNMSTPEKPKSRRAVATEKKRSEGKAAMKEIFLGKKKKK